MNDELIITGSFNGLLDRLAKIDYFDVWLTLKSSMKAAKKQESEPTVRISEVSTLTGLTTKDFEFLCVSLRLIECVEAGEDPLVSFTDTFCLVKIFERFVNEGVLSSK